MTTPTARLYAVPDPAPRQRLPWLLRLRRLARQAYDLAVSVPRGALDWAVSTASRWGQSISAAMPGLMSALARTGRAATAVGILPMTATALTTPQVLQPLLGAARRVLGALSGPLARLGRWVAAGLRTLDPVGPAVLDLARRAHGMVSTAVGRLALMVRRVFGERGLEHATTASRAASYAWITRRAVLAVTGSAWAAVVIPIGVAGLTLTLLHRADAADAKPTATPPAAPPQPEDAVSSTEVLDEPLEDAAPWGNVPVNRASRRATQQAAARSRRR